MPTVTRSDGTRIEGRYLSVEFADGTKGTVSDEDFGNSGVACATIKRGSEWPREMEERTTIEIEAILAIVERIQREKEESNPSAASSL